VVPPSRSIMPISGLVRPPAAVIDSITTLQEGGGEGGALTRGSAPAERGEG
jgi:hypothetical protein